MASVVFVWLLFLLIVNSLTTSIATTTTTSTAATTTSTTTTTTTTPPSSLETLPSTDAIYCWCDLRPKQCDVNCCCDDDCTSSDRLSFSRCVDHYQPVDPRTCIQKYMLFRNNTPYTVDTTVSGLFCIHTNNYNSANYYKAPSLVTSPSEFDYYWSLSSGYSYSEQFASRYNIKTANNQHYVSGDPILTVYPTSDGSTLLGMLAFPTSATSSMNCINNNPAAYLYGETLTCVQPIPRDRLSVECTENAMLRASTYYEGFKLVRSPAAMNSSQSEPLYNSKHAVKIEHDQVSSPVWNNGICHHVVTKVVYKLWYAGTDGITDATVSFTYSNITDDDLPLSQTFSLHFYQNGTTANMFRYSGNPGYIVRQPVRAGHLVTNHAGISAVEMGSDRSNWLTMLSSNAEGLCRSNANSHVPVLFGVNMRSGCFIAFTYNNMSSLCNESQNQAMSALLGNYPPSHIATFGNTSVENTASWIPIYRNITSGACSLTSGPTSSSPGLCNNIITGMNMHIVYANVGAVSSPQAQIIGAEYQFVCQSQLRFQCPGKYCHPSTMNTTVQRFEVVSSVSFVDASSPASPGYAQLPSSSSSLPSDFFYPLT